MKEEEKKLRVSEGPHDQLAGASVVSRHPKRISLLFWCFLLVICGVIGIAAWLQFFYSPSSNGVALEARWVKRFDQENTYRIVSYVNREEQCIVSTATSMFSLDMHTGNTLWSLENLPEASIQPLSGNPHLPLLTLQYQPDDKWMLSNIDPVSGKIIWQQAIKGYNPRITFDPQTILVYDDTALYGYDMQGTQLWSRHFEEQRVLRYAYLHTDILIGRYSDSSLTLAYLARDSGETIWEMKNSRYRPGYVPGKDRQCFYTDKDDIILMDVPGQRPLWDEPLDLGHVAGHDEIQGSAEDPSGLYIYATNSAIRAEDGTIMFSYPPGGRFGSLTKDFLIILRDSDTRQTEILLVDKSSGNVKHGLRGRPWSFVFYLTENHSRIYLAANLKPEKSGIIDVPSELLVIDKQTFDFKETPVGGNIGSLQFKLFPQKNFVFIPSFQIIGGYSIPEG